MYPWCKPRYMGTKACSGEPLGISGVPWLFLGSGSRGETSGSRGNHPTAAPEWFTDTRLMQALIMYHSSAHNRRLQ